MITDVDAWLQKELAAKEAREAKEKVSEKQAAEEAKWLQGYAKKRLVNNYGGNYWGINRNRCSIIRPAMIKALVAGGHIKMVGSSFQVVEK